MPLLTRRNLLKASAVAGAYGAGIGIAGRFGLPRQRPSRSC
ncbi:metallo-oxidoreductase [Rhizobium sp. Pop5]|nr:metallo-oxidoreductase [Rhizobium sp. Pop5]